MFNFLEQLIVSCMRVPILFNEIKLELLNVRLRM